MNTEHDSVQYGNDVVHRLNMCLPSMVKSDDEDVDDILRATNAQNQGRLMS